MIDKVKEKIITALEQADIHFETEWDQAEDAPREFDPLDYLSGFKATPIGVTGDYLDDEGGSMSSFTVLLDDRFLVHFDLSLPQYCDEESDARLGLDIHDLGEDPDTAMKTAYQMFNEEVSRVTMDAVWRVFHCTSVESLGQSAELQFYQELAKIMHCGIDEQICKRQAAMLDHQNNAPLLTA